MVIYGEVVGFDTGSPFFDVDLTKLRTIDPVENLTSVNVSAAASYQTIQDAVKTGRPVRRLFQYKDQENWTVGVHLSAVHVPDDWESDTLVLSGLCGSSIRGAATSKIQLQIRDDGVFLDYYADIADDGVKVTSVNGEIPDENGNVNITIPAGTVTSVNGEEPDEAGYVTLRPDDTLSIEGAFADAKAVGDQLGNIATLLDAINGEVI